MEPEPVPPGIDPRALRGHARRAFVPAEIVRDDGLAIVAAVARTCATEIMFHHIGDPPDPSLKGLEALRAFHDSATAFGTPALRDDQATSYRRSGPSR